MKGYVGDDIHITLRSVKITSSLEKLVNDIESANNKSNDEVIQSAIDLITECIEQDGDISEEDKTVAMETIAGKFYRYVR